MQGDPGVGGQRLEDVPVDHGVVRHTGTGDGEVHQVIRFTGVHEVRPSGNVDGGMRQRLVHRNESVAEPADPLLVAERLPERGAQHDGGVLDRVVALDLDVPAGGDGQIEAGVAAQRGEHVVEEGNPGLDGDRTGAVEVEFDDDVGLSGLALDSGAPGCLGHGAPCGSGPA